MSPSAPRPTAIIDTHHHLWCLSQGHWPWLQDRYDPDAFILGDYQALRRDFDVATFRQSHGAWPVVGTVHVEAERSRDEAWTETRWLEHRHARHGLPSAIVAWSDLMSPDAEIHLDRQAGSALVRGIRCKPTIARSACGTCPERHSLRDPAWRHALALLAERRLVWDLRIPFWHLADAARLLEHVPDADVALEHLGLPWDRTPAGLARWRQGLSGLSENPRVFIKLSELGLKDGSWNRDQNAALIAEAIDIFGWQRCMFGSNFPVASLRASYTELIHTTRAAMARAGLDRRQQQAIWHDNAVAFYRLKGKEA